MASISDLTLDNFLLYAEDFIMLIFEFRKLLGSTLVALQVHPRCDSAELSKVWFNYREKIKIE